MMKSRLDDHISELIHRSSLFQCLLDNPQNRAQLTDQVDASRTTVYRALEELQSYGLVAFSANKFRPTPYGELLFYALNELRQHAEIIQQSESFLQALPEDIPVAYQLVATGKVVESSFVNPRAPLSSLCDFIDEASTIKAAAKVIYPEDAETYYRNIMSDSMDCTLISQNKIMDQMRSVSEEELEKVIQSTESRFLTTEKDIPFSLIISEDPEQRVCVAIYDDRGNLQGVILNESDMVYDWAVNKFNSIKRHDTTGQVSKWRPGNGSVDTAQRVMLPERRASTNEYREN